MEHNAIAGVALNDGRPGVGVKDEMDRLDQQPGGVWEMVDHSVWSVIEDILDDPVWDVVRPVQNCVSDAAHEHMGYRGVWEDES